MRTNYINVATTDQAQIDQYIREIGDIQDKIKEVSDRSGLYVEFTIGNRSITYTPKPIGEILTQKEALEILRSGNYLNDGMRQKIARVLEGEGGVRYTDEDRWDSSYDEYSFGWNSSY